LAGVSRFCEAERNGTGFFLREIAVERSLRTVRPGGCEMKYPEIERQHRQLRGVMKRIRGLLGERAGQRVDLAAETRSLANELRAHFEAEESGGYLDVVLEKRPGWSRRVDGLREQHREILQELADLARRPAAQIAEQLGPALDRVQAHDTEECDLVQRAVIEDIGSGD
jgi:hypothetical protein